MNTEIIIILFRNQVVNKFSSFLLLFYFRRNLARNWWDNEGIVHGTLKLVTDEYLYSQYLSESIIS